MNNSSLQQSTGGICLFLCTKQPVMQDQQVMVQANIVLMLHCMGLLRQRITNFLHNFFAISFNVLLLVTIFQLSFTIPECLSEGTTSLFMTYW